MRTTPAQPGLFSLITLFANRSARRGQWPIRVSAWYTKESATFSDALALVRQRVGCKVGFLLSPGELDSSKLSRAILERLIHARCDATA